MIIQAFVYSFDQRTHNIHTDDLSYLMGIHGFEKDENEKVIETHLTIEIIKEQCQEIAKFYPQLFINFTKYGVPSPSEKKYSR